MTGTIINLVTGATIRAHTTTDHPDSHFGRAVWVGDADNVAYLEVDCPIPNPFYVVQPDPVD